MGALKGIPMHPAFDLDRTVDGVAVVTVHGAVDLQQLPAFSAVLASAVEASDAFLLDLCGCSFIDSSGLSAILAASRRAGARGVQMAVAFAEGSAPRVLCDMTIGDSFFVAYDDRAAGVAALRRGL